MRQITRFAFLILFISCSYVFADDFVPLQSQSIGKLSFIENKGQWDQKIRYASLLPGRNFILTNNGFVLDRYELRDITNKNGEKCIERSGNVLKISFSGINQSTVFTGTINAHKRNYFLGNDSRSWITNVKEFSTLAAINIYEDIDVLFISHNGAPRFDFVLKPGADPGKIRLTYEGAVKCSIDDGSLLFEQENGSVVSLGNLYAFQLIDGKEVKVDCSFEINNSTIGFKVGNYDNTRPLVIDPVIFSAFTGGNDADEVNGAKLDHANNLVVAGVTLSQDLMITPGAYSEVSSGGKDIFVSKYKVMGADKLCLFTTYIGGSNDDIANGVDVDLSGNIYVGGESNSENYPIASAYGQMAFGKRDIIATKLNPTGDTILYSTYIGGSKDDYAMAIAVGASGAAYLTGGTYSTNFPSVNDYNFQGAKGMEEAFIIKLSTQGSALLFSTLMTTAGLERGMALSVDEDQMAVVVGGETDNARFYTYPNQFPSPVFDRYYNGSYDGFIAKFGSTGGKCDFSSFFGGPSDDRIKAVCLKPNGLIIIAGITNSTLTKVSATSNDTEFPLTSSSYYTKNRGGNDGFFAEIGKKGEILNTSSFFGGKADDEIVACGYNKKKGSIYFAGVTSSSDMPVVNDEMQSKFKGQKDIFLSEFNANVTTIQLSTLIGGTGIDIVKAMAFDTEGDVYLVGSTSSNAFPIVNEFDEKSYLGGTSDGFVYKYTTKTLKLNSPKKNTEYCRGTLVQFSWSTTGFDTETKYNIDCSIDSGETWTSLLTDLKGSDYNWAIPNNFTCSDNYLFRISTYNGLVAKSDGYIAIVGAPVVNSIQMTTPSTICVGEPVRIVAEAIGKDLQYTWKKDGVKINNASSNELSIPAANETDAGKYEVVVSNACKPDAVSQSVDLTVTHTTSVTAEPESITRNKGEEAIFSVTADGSGLAYQWLKNGSKMLTETSQTLMIISCVKDDEGSYSCIVTGDCGIDTSSVAVLTVLDTLSLNDTGSPVLENCISSSGIGPDGEILIDVTSTQFGNARIGLYSYTGMLFYEHNYRVEPGMNRLVLDNKDMPSAGVYLVVYRSEDTVCYSRIVIW